MSSINNPKVPSTDLINTAEFKDPFSIPWTRSGVNRSVGAEEEDLWGVGGLQVFPTTPTVATLSSTSAADAVAGTGALVVRVYGLNTSYLRISEDITMTGLTPVSGIVPFYRVTKLEVMSTGSAGYNLGDITVVVDGNPQALIQIEDNYSHNINYTVPANYWLFITDFSIMAEAGRDILIKTFFRHPTVTHNLWRNQASYIVPAPTIGRSPRPSFVFPPYSDFAVRAQKLTGSTVYASALGVGYLSSHPDLGSANLDSSDSV